MLIQLGILLSLWQPASVLPSAASLRECKQSLYELAVHFRSEPFKSLNLKDRWFNLRGRIWMANLSDQMDQKVQTTKLNLIRLLRRIENRGENPGYHPLLDQIQPKIEAALLDDEEVQNIVRALQRTERKRDEFSPLESLRTLRQITKPNYNLSILEGLLAFNRIQAKSGMGILVAQEFLTALRAQSVIFLERFEKYPWKQGEEYERFRSILSQLYEIFLPMSQAECNAYVFAAEANDLRVPDDFKDEIEASNFDFLWMGRFSISQWAKGLRSQALSEDLVARQKWQNIEDDFINSLVAPSAFGQPPSEPSTYLHRRKRDQLDQERKILVQPWERQLIYLLENGPTDQLAKHLENPPSNTILNWGTSEAEYFSEILKGHSDQVNLVLQKAVVKYFISRFEEIFP